MPAIVTHNLFGQRALERLDDLSLVHTAEERQAFLLGNQGPDPLAARFLTTADEAEACHALGEAMQDHATTQTFLTLLDCIYLLPQRERRVGEALVLGMLGHYALDRAAHPLVISQEIAIAEAGVGLADARREVHAVLESELDSWMLWRERGETVTGAGAAGCLARTDRIDKAGGALFCRVALAVYGMSVDLTAYPASVADYARVCRIIDPQGTPWLRALGVIERRLHGHSLLQGLSHPSVTSDDACPTANLAHDPWRHPYTDEVMTASFPELFSQALDLWQALAQAFAGGDEKRLAALIDGINYAGEPGRD